LYPVPLNESERLVEMEALRLIDTAASLEFDTVTKHLKDIFGAEQCSIALVDRDRIWFKSRIGIFAPERPRDGSFAAYTILSNEILVVEDARLDERFKDMPIVAGEPGLRFYAGAPLMVRPGIAIGSLAVLDSRPRRVTAKERAALEAMAKVVVGLIEVNRLAAVSEARRVEIEEQRRALEIREAQFKQTETIARVGGWEWDLATNRVNWSDEVYRIHDMPVGEPVTVEMAMSVYPPDQRERMRQLIERLLTDRSSFSEVFRIVSFTGRHKWVQIAGDVEELNGTVVRLFGILQDITESHEAQRKLLEAANTDALTGLANRHRFTTLLSERFASGRTSPFGLMMIDVDHLKEVNDSLGHDAGDALIRTVASRLVQCTRPGDVAARLGGDEFALIVATDGSEEALSERASEIIGVMGPRIIFNGRTIAPQVSIGVATPAVADTPDAIRQKADIALYHAKDVRRGGYVGFSESLRSSISARVETTRQLDEALVEKRVEAHYQPIVNLRTGRIEGVEALARIRMPDGTLRSAGEFASALDDSRNAVRLTTTMLNALTRDLKAWRKAGVQVGRVGINATTADFRDGDLDRRIVEAFQAVRLPLTLVTLEVTETVFLSQVAQEVGRTLISLRKHGVRVALDDFGTGHASLANLGTLPVDVIKIDRSFIANMADHKVSEAIVKSLIDLGEVLAITVVAEGVETEEQLLRLQRMGCHAGQGYLFARPLPPSDMAAFAAAFSARRPTPIGKSEVHFVA
jgi:diguanylate cyclase (GGDEF)-like protein/PAS domain S-box-containing protein